jgi:hypothetical protein
MSDFETVLRQYVTEQSATADARYTLDPTGEARVLAWRVRRRRASRVGGVAAVAAAAVLVASAGVYAATRPEAVPPAGTPTPSVSPTPEESPAEDVDPGEQPAVTGSALLPTSLPLEPGMLAAAPAGSTLVTFVATCGYPCAEPESAPTLYLVTPDGGIFDAGLDVADLSLTDWLPGTSVALFARYDGAESAWVAVDVETGQLVGQPVPHDPWSEGDAWLGGNGDVLRARVDWEDDRSFTVLERVSLTDGSVLASTEAPGDPEVVWGPGRDRFFLRRSTGVTVYDTRTLDVVALPTMTDTYGPCFGVDWWDAGSVVVSCGVVTPDMEGVTRGVETLRRVGLDGTVTTLAPYPHVAPYAPVRVWQMGGRTVLAPLPESEQGAWLDAPEDVKFVLLENGELTYVTADYGEERLTYLGASATHVVAARHAPPGESSLVLVDPTTGAITPLLTATEPGWGAFLLAVSNQGGVA